MADTLDTTKGTRWVISKFKDPSGEMAERLRDGAKVEDLTASGVFIGQSVALCNTACNEGLNELIDIIINSGSPTKWQSGSAYLGVGNGTAAANATDTGLSGASKTYMGMDSGYPSRSTGQKAVWRATFATGDANYAWEEYTVVNASTDTGKNLNHKVESKGTKSSGETWTLQLEITFS
jgi:hypothetical protein